MLFWISHTMELSRRCLVKGNILLKIASHVLLETLRAVLCFIFMLHTPLFASFSHKIHLRFGQISKSLCSQSLGCFRVWNPALKIPEVLLYVVLQAQWNMQRLGWYIYYSHFPLSVGVYMLNQNEKPQQYGSCSMTIKAYFSWDMLIS